jgi:glyoxylase I family protein
VPELLGFSHIDLTVSDGEKSAAWWQDVLGFVLVTRSDGESFEVWNLAHPSGVIVSVMTHRGTPREAFDERRVGLDHFSFQVADREELERWITHLDAHGVTHSGIMDATWGPTVVFRDPNNIQLDSSYIRARSRSRPVWAVDRSRTRRRRAITADLAHTSSTGSRPDQASITRARHSGTAPTGRSAAIQELRPVPAFWGGVVRGDGARSQIGSVTSMRNLLASTTNAPSRCMRSCNALSRSR